MIYDNTSQNIIILRVDRSELDMQYINMFAVTSCFDNVCLCFVMIVPSC